MGMLPRRVRPAIVVAAALLVAACSSPAEPGEGGDPSDAEASTSVDQNGTDDVAVAQHTVEPPGPLEGRLYGDDMLLVSSETITDDLLDQINEIRIAGQKAVTATERMSIGEFSVENRSYRIAAVDAGEYRRFTTAASEQAPWDRIAGGEVAVRSELDGRLPLDRNGYLEVGSGERTFPIHVGAYSPQIGTVDAVVNSAWGEALDLPQDNAVVLYTGGISPQALRPKLKKILGDISMTDLDIVAERGLDPNTFQSVQYVGTFDEAVGVYRYTPIGDGRVQPEAAWVREHIVTDTVPLLGTITCNKAMMPQLKGALAEVQAIGLGKEIYQTAGCYYPRFIAGTTTLSNHSFGLAIDINSLENQRGTVGQMHPTVVQIFKKWGFAWGGDWNWTDPMHFELAQIVEAAG